MIYEYANADGSIDSVEYDDSKKISQEKIKDILQESFSRFPYTVDIEYVNNWKDVFKINFPDGKPFQHIYICGKGTTPGGRKNLKNEQRIQTKAKYFNYVYEKQNSGTPCVFLGVYERDNSLLFCTWKVKKSDTPNDENPISKQVKIASIARAMKEGYYQQPKGEGEFVYIFKPAFLYFYLNNCDWLNETKINHLNINNTFETDETTDSDSLDITFHTDLFSEFKRNQIIFGAPGTGKSYLLDRQRMELIGKNNEEDYIRTTFYPEYSYANFVGTYKPVMSDEIQIGQDHEIEYIISTLKNKNKTAQEMYDLLYDKFSNDEISLKTLCVLLGLSNDQMFTSKDMTGAVTTDNELERSIGSNLNKYIDLRLMNEKSSKITYEFVPGPFLQVYVNAIKNAQTDEPRPFLLIIEEINRANAAAVFGDIFQLLDRGENNISTYPIQATEDIKKYLSMELGGTPENYSKLYIPDNMFIWATMNSADQGVYPLDTAFKRRWNFTYLDIDENEDDIQGKYVKIGKTGQCFEWNELRKAINWFLSDQNINEDKLIGPYYISREIVVPSIGNEIDSSEFCDIFKNKVLMYLFEDAAKHIRKKIFQDSKYGYNRFSSVCEAFDEQGINIFNPEIRKKVRLQLEKNYAVDDEVSDKDLSEIDNNK